MNDSPFSKSRDAAASKNAFMNFEIRVFIFILFFFDFLSKHIKGEMPARKVGTALQKANEENKKTSRTATKPIISVTEKSSPGLYPFLIPSVGKKNSFSFPFVDKILQSSWLFLTTFQFFSIFQNYFELPTLDIEELEQALIQPDTSALLETVIVRILAPLLSRRSVNRENYEKHLQDLFPDVAPFHTLSIVDKIKLLKRIEEANLETEDFLSWKNEVNVDELVNSTTYTFFFINKI